MLGLITAFNLIGGFIAYFYLSKIKANQKAWEFFSGYLMIILALDLLIVHLINIKLMEFNLIYVASGFATGFLTLFVLMTLFHLISKKSEVDNIHNHKTFSILIFLLLGVHEVSEGFGISEIFFEGSRYIPLKLTLAPVTVLGLHEFPEGILLVLPFFLSKRIRTGFFALLTNQFIFIISALLLYFYFLQFYEPSIGEEAFLGTLPAGGIFFLGLHDLITAFKNPQKVEGFTKSVLVAASFSIFLIVSASLILTNARVEKIKQGETDYECSREFSIENCLE